MRVILGERGAGKTTELIKESRKTGYPILVTSHKRAEYIKNMNADIYPKLQDIPTPIVLNSLPRIQHQTKRSRILIDDLEDVLKHIFAIDVDTVTITSDREFKSLSTSNAVMTGKFLDYTYGDHTPTVMTAPESPTTFSEVVSEVYKTNYDNWFDDFWLKYNIPIESAILNAAERTDRVIYLEPDFFDEEDETFRHRLYLKKTLVRITEKLGNTFEISLDYSDEIRIRIAWTIK